MADYWINILNLTKENHSFNYQLNDRFFLIYGTELISTGNFAVSVNLNKGDTLIEANFKIKGSTTLICDKSLDRFDQPIQIDKRILFKYGEQAMEISDEVIIIPYDLQMVDLGQLIYEFIVLEIPLRKVHPRFQQLELEDDISEEGCIIYQSTKNEEIVIDPRWEKLKNLK